MPLMPHLFSLWRNLAHRARVERDLDEEVRAAFDLLVEEKVQGGMRPEAARRAATLDLGHVEAVKEQVRDIRAGAAADAFFQDVRYGARLLRRNPSFAVTAALSLAIGIGANTTVFTIANALLFRAPAGVREPDRLVDIFRAEEGRTLSRDFSTSYPYYIDVRQRATMLDEVYAYELELQPVNLRSADGTELAFANLVTGNYFTALGVLPAAGRLLGHGDDTDSGANPVVVLSHRFWTRRFGADPSLVGRTVHINRHPFTVVGVAHGDFRGTNVVSADLWVPIAMADVVQPGTSRLASRSASGLGVGGRLKPPRVTILARAAGPHGIAPEIRGLVRSMDPDLPVLTLQPLDAQSGPAHVQLRVAASVAGSVGLIGLLLAAIGIYGVTAYTTARRTREIGIRVAMGAQRADVLAMVLRDGMSLVALGSLAGLILAAAGGRVTASLLHRVPPLDLWTVGGATLLFGLVGLAACYLPALRAMQIDPMEALRYE